MILLIQFDVCSPLIDSLNYQLDVTESTMSDSAENQENADDEVYYKLGKKQMAKDRYLLLPNLADMRCSYIPTISILNDDPVPKALRKIVQQHIINCVYRI